ncbi:MAG: hypothetical protein ACREO8_10775, partial [Luteimonas sp.]
MRTSKLLLGTMLGLCFASSANAASLAPVNTEFTLTGGVTMIVSPPGNSSTTCSASLVGAIDSAGRATITAGSIGGADGCAVLKFMGFPWSLTATDAGSIRLEGFDIYYPVLIGVYLPTKATATYDGRGTLT